MKMKHMIVFLNKIDRYIRVAEQKYGAVSGGRVRLKGGEYAYLYLLCEHQSIASPLMPFRVWQYMINVWADHLKQHKDMKLSLSTHTPCRDSYYYDLDHKTISWYSR
jgi:Putative transposase, YhgA-like